MTTFVLVHGAWHGGWVWRKVAAPLRAKGHRVFTPTLTGLGERAHLASLDVNLDTHIQDVIGLLEAEELTDVVLVGHSYAGVVITGVADKAAGRLSGLVYIDAFVPESGFSLQSNNPIRFEMFAKHVDNDGNDTMILPADASMWAVVDPADVEWLNRRLTAQPINTYTQKLVHDVNFEEFESLTYIYASGNKLGQFDKFTDKFSADPAWQYYAVGCGHEVMVDRPDKLIEILSEVAGD
tara:strand:- start:1181 stop:1894 length:714 start_codon:yes stop_codon:yes gene_type:complete